MIIWGFNVIATKMLVTSFLPVTMTAFRIFTAGVSVFIILFFMKQVRLPSKKEIQYIVLGGLLGVVGHHYYLSVGLSETSASNGGLILGLIPLITTILSIFFLNAKVTLIRFFGIVLGLAGVSIIVFNNRGIGGGISIGDFHVFLSVLFQAASFIVIKKASKTLDPRLLTGYMLVLGSVFLFILSIFLEPAGLKSMTTGSVSIWVIFFASAIIATALGHMIYNVAVGKVGAAEASIFINLNPFFALIGAAFFLSEVITLTQILGFILILIGVIFGSGAFEEMVRANRQKREKIEVSNSTSI